MGDTAKIVDGYIEIDTGAWLAQRTACVLEEMSALFSDFSAVLKALTAPTLHPPAPGKAIELFLVARSGLDWAEGEPGAKVNVQTRQALSLSDGVSVYRYSDPEYGRVALVTGAFGPYAVGNPVAYADSARTPDLWSALAVRIDCSRGHQFHYTGTEITTATSGPLPVVDVFPSASLVTLADPDACEPTWHILCPICAACCDVELAAPEQRDPLTQYAP